MRFPPLEAGRNDVVARRESRLLIERLNNLMAERGMPAREVSRRAGLGLTAVHDIVSLKNKNPSAPALQAIAKVLQTHLAYLVGDSDDAEWVPEGRRAQPIPVIAVAETGTYRAMAAVGQNRGFSVIHAPPSIRHPTAERFAVEVRDDAMNAASGGPITQGMYVLCVDLAAESLTIESRSIYVCRRSKDGGETFETIIRRAMVYADRIELLAESTRQIYEKITIPRDQSMELAAQIHAIGLVYAALTSFE